MRALVNFRIVAFVLSIDVYLEALCVSFCLNWHESVLLKLI